MKIAAFLLTAAVLGCSSGQPGTSDAQPDGFGSELALAEPVDLNDDPNVIEINLEARAEVLPIQPGTSTEVWTYNGALPGPLIRAKVGDRLIVHFTNHLPESTTIHWHGMRIPVEMDGVPEHSQNVVEPGGTFEYSFVIPDAGLYWYHPHYDSAEQVGNGLYGAILVEEPGRAPIGDELVVVLSDLGVKEDGSLQPPDTGGDIGTLFGREGELLLVNGRVRPKLEVRSGKLIRLHLVNTAKSRYFELALEGHDFHRIGGDGGLSEFGVTSQTVVLAPAERADVLVIPQGRPGTSLPLRWVAFDRGYGSTFNRPDEPLLDIAFAGEPASSIDEFPATSRVIEPLDLSRASEVNLDLTQALDPNKELILGINGVPAELAEPRHAKVGTTEIWNVSTEMDWSHPFHLHGFFFQVLDENGQPRRPLEWKDTVDVPYQGRTKLAVHYDGRPGMWMFHCHILDHADAGMMGHLHLEP